jgi:hypothetical protein
MMNEVRLLKRVQVLKEAVPFWWSACLIAVLLVAVPVPASMVDRYYSRDAYPIMQGVVTTMSNAIPIAVLDLLLLALILLFVRWAVRGVRVARAHGARTAVWDVFRRVVRTAAIVAILFFLMWGLNYRRTSLVVSLKLTAPPPSADDLQSAILEANELAGRIRPSLAPNKAPGYEDVVRRLPEPFRAALRQLNRPLLRVPGRPKYSLVLTPYFTAAGIDGMIDPLALESVVHPDLLPVERPFVLAHEWAHLAGAADEAEASAIGWLACMKGDPPLAYSASVYLIGEAGSSLPRDRWRAVAGHLDPAVRRDLDAIARRVAREQPTVQRTAARVYDTYLKANRVGDGVASYSRALTLILSPTLRVALAQARVPRRP